MEIHVPTLFLVIVAVSITLSAALAWVAYGRDRKLLFWAGAGTLALHALAYGLFSLYGQIHDGASIAASNALPGAAYLSSTLGLILLALCLVVMAKDPARRGELFVQDVLDSVSSQIAVIDENGIILSVNQAWRQFSMDNSPQPGHLAPRTGVGTSYLGICKSPGAMSDGAQQAAQGLQDVLSHRLPSFSLEYACHAPHQQRWFTMNITPLGGGRKGAVVVHTDITARKLAEEQIRNLAYYDPLTRLPNRRMLQERLTLALGNCRRSGLHGALMLLDLDNFKPLNDLHGHLAGDLLLMEVAHRLGAHVREIDTVARQGGDEFVVLLAALHPEAAASRAQALAVAEKLRAALAQPYVLTAQTEPAGPAIVHHCSASIGVTLFNGLDTQPNDIVKRADEAMYQAKNAGRNTVHLHP